MEIENFLILLVIIFLFNTDTKSVVTIFKELIVSFLQKGVSAVFSRKMEDIVDPDIINFRLNSASPECKEILHGKKYNYTMQDYFTLGGVMNNQSEAIRYIEQITDEHGIYSFYTPELLADDNRVDRLSLYLTLHNSPDERVTKALRENVWGSPMVKGLTKFRFR
ncbi:MAG: hypothetical protein V1789_00610 [PVC group bacterium]